MSDFADISKKIRLKCLEVCYQHKASHLGGAFSVADILSVLYFDFLNIDVKNSEWDERDRLFYSKGHACTALYAALEERGFFSGLVEKFGQKGDFFTSHVNHKVPGIELSTGSLGHALSVAVGSALAARLNNKSYKVVTIVSDGELDEGSNWEPILFAPHHKLDNLLLIVDYNKIQSFGRVDEVLGLDSLSEKFKSFHWNTLEIDGHDYSQIKSALEKFKNNTNSRPTVIIANTVKGKGVSYMENSLAWHYKSPNEQEYKLAKIEILKS